MLDIYICEDNRQHLKQIQNVIENQLAMHDFQERIYFTGTDPNSLLEFLSVHHDNTGLYFLDIEFPGTSNGIEVALSIRQTDPRAYIVFITSHLEMSYMTFEHHLEALHFIPKLNWNQVKNKIFECMKTANERQLQTESKNIDSDSLMTIKIDGEQMTLRPADILCIQTAGQHRLQIVTIKLTILHQLQFSLHLITILMICIAVNGRLIKIFL